MLLGYRFSWVVAATFIESIAGQNLNLYNKKQIISKGQVDNRVKYLFELQRLQLSPIIMKLPGCLSQLYFWQNWI